MTKRDSYSQKLILQAVVPNEFVQRKARAREIVAVWCRTHKNGLVVSVFLKYIYFN